MGDLVFISGDFSSGTTLLFTLFRHVDGTHCLYEPMHERLLPWLFWPPRVYEGHGSVDAYFSEYTGFSAIPRLFDPSWGTTGLYLDRDAEAPELNRYLTYLIGSSYGRAPRVVLKGNRLTFKLGWLKATFPRARIVNVWRDRDDQWRSWVRRVQEHLGRDDVGQDAVDFMGFRLAAWCDDLEDRYPQLAAARSASGYERFSKLWDLSRREHERHADVCIELRQLREDFDGSCRRISDAVGFELDAARLRHLVAPERRETEPRPRARRLGLVDRLGQAYAEARVRRQLRRRGPTVTRSPD